MDAAKNVAETVSKQAENAVNYVSDSINAAVSGASKETNKSIAKDSNAPIGDRLKAAGDALGDKADETKHDASKEVHKQNI